jgi:hypothetical protein
MKKIFFLFSVVALFAGVNLTQSCKKSNSAPAEYVATNSSFAGFTSWPLQSTKHGPDPLLVAMAHANNDSTVTRDVYFKDGQNAVNGKYPVGTIIVKHSYNPSGTVMEYTGLVKRGNNFNPAHGDWEFFMLKSDGTIMADSTGMVMRGANLMGGMCASCHSAATKDYVFSK